MVLAVARLIPRPRPHPPGLETLRVITRTSTHTAAFVTYILLLTYSCSLPSNTLPTLLPFSSPPLPSPYPTFAMRSSSIPTFPTIEPPHSLNGDSTDVESRSGYITTSGEDTTDADEKHIHVNTIHATSDNTPTKLEAATEILKNDTAAHKGEDDLPLPSGLALVMISVALCLSVFCLALDNTIIATAIPVITNQFHSLGDVGWYGSSYLLCTVSFGELTEDWKGN